MTKAELQALEQKTAEAQRALKSSVEEYKASRNPETATPEGLKPEEFRQKVSDKYQKAKEDFTKFSNELAAARAAMADEADVSDMEAALADWEKQQKHWTEPATRAPRKASDAHVDDGEKGERFHTSLDREAFELERLYGVRQTTEQKNLVRMLRGESLSYYRRENGKVIDARLTAEQDEVYRDMLNHYMFHGVEDTRFQAARFKFSQMVPSEKYALLTSSGDSGGFLVPEDFHAEVIKDLVGLSVFRQICRVIQTGRDVAVFPTVKAASNANADKGYTSGFSGSWKNQRSMSGGATALDTQDQPKFGSERIQIHRWEPDAIEVPLEFVEDPGVNAMQVLAEVIAETKAMDEVSVFTNGTGTGEPEGVLSTGAALRTKDCGASGTFTYSGLIDLTYDLAAPYRQNASMMMNSASYGTILGLTDTDGGPIFAPNTMPGTLWGKPVVFNEFMPDVGNGNKPIVYGDFRHYIIADRMELRVMRLMERMAPNQGLLPIARLGAQATRVNAFRVGVTPT